MKTVNILRIFLASPGDVKAEREMIFALKDDLDLLIGKDKDIKFEIINWERNTYPGKGDDAQDVINGQIKDDYDIFLGIFWQRFGTPTNRYESGSLEEYERAKIKFDLDPENTHILMYFKNQEADIYKVDIEQFKKVKEFRDKIANEDGIYYSMFEKTEDLKTQLQLNLANLIREKFIKKEILQEQDKVDDLKLIDKGEQFDKYELLAKKIDKGDYNIHHLNLEEDVEKINNHLYDLASTSSSITTIMTFLTSKTRERVKQFKTNNNIKDEKFRMIRAKKISNDYATDLDRYSEDIENIMPEFKTSINNVINTYSEVILKTINEEEIQKDITKNIPDLINSIEGTLESIADLLKAFMDSKIYLTSKFSSAKRRSELATNNIFKEFINTRNLLKQLLNKE